MANDDYTMEWTLKRDWIDALRSGKYKQGRYAYHRYADTYCYRYADTYCCLAVERVVAVGKWDNCTPSRAGDISPRLQSKLISLNDTEARDFNYIADWIEDNVRAVL